MVTRYAVCSVAMVLLPSLVLPNRMSNYKSDGNGSGSLTKHGLAMDLKDNTAFSGRELIALNEC